MTSTASATSAQMNQQLLTQNLRACHDIILSLEQSKASIERMIDGLPDIFVVVDQTGRVLKGNATAARLFSVEIEQVLYMRLPSLFRRETWEIFASKVAQCVKDNTTAEFELQIDGEGLEERAFHWNIQVLEEVSGRRGPLISAFGRDITQIRAYEKRLSQIFSAIPLGIITINSEGIIEGPYSAYCEVLLATPNLNGKSFYDLVFASSMGDMADREQSGIAELKEIFGREELWFDIAKERFPSEFPYHGPDGGSERWLGVVYHPIIQNDLVVKILIVLEDRTEIVKSRLAEESLRQLENRVTERMVDIQRCDEPTLAASLEDLGQFFPRLDDAFTARDFRNFCNVLHGIKGVARTAGYRYLKAATHELEGEVLKVLDGGGTVDPANVQPMYDRIAAEWSAIRQLIQVFKGLKSDSGAESTALKEASAALSKSFTSLKARMGQGTSAVAQELAVIEREIRNLALHRLSSIEEKLKARAAQTATVLKKSINFAFDWQDVFVDRETLATLSECFLHLINNAIDHGIESAEDRQRLGKPTAGSVSVKVFESGGMINCTFADDGGGINIAKVRERALERKIITAAAAAQMSEEEIMGIIFRPGFSTATTVSEISGRGIGLDSVAESVRRMGGQGIKVSKGDKTGTKLEFSIKCSH